MDVTLHVPVPRFVLKFCLSKFGEQTSFGKAWRLSTRYKEGKTLWALLDRMPYRQEKYHKNDEMLNILIPSKIARLRGCYLTQESINMFIDYIKEVIIDEILLFHTGIHSQIGIKAIDKIAINQYLADKNVRVLRVTGSEAHKFYWQKKIISDILMKYDINEDDLSHDAVVKCLQRYGSAQVSA